MLNFYPQKMPSRKISLNRKQSIFDVLHSIFQKGKAYSLLVSTHFHMTTFYELRELTFRKNDIMVALTPITWLLHMSPIYTGATSKSLILWHFFRNRSMTSGPLIPLKVDYHICSLLLIFQSCKLWNMKTYRPGPFVPFKTSSPCLPYCGRSLLSLLPMTGHSNALRSHRYSKR